MSTEELIEEIGELNPDALLADGLEAGLIGYTQNSFGPIRAVYDVDRCIDIFVSDGMTPEEAEEYMSFNVLGAYVGENGPVFITIRRQGCLSSQTENTS